MKKVFRPLTLITAMSIALLLGACNGGDPAPTPSEMIVGSWHISSATVDIKVGTQSLVDYLVSQGLSTEDAQALETSLKADYGGTDGTIEVKKGGTYSATSDGSTDTGTWELSADGKTLTLDKGTADATTFTVTTLTATSLVMSFDETETDNDVTLTVHVVITLSK